MKHLDLRESDLVANGFLDDWHWRRKVFPHCSFWCLAFFRVWGFGVWLIES
jgi:hypothetical protein